MTEGESRLPVGPRSTFEEGILRTAGGDLSPGRTSNRSLASRPGGDWSPGAGRSTSTASGSPQAGRTPRSRRLLTLRRCSTVTRATLTLEDEALLRGVSHLEVLHHFGKLLRNSEGKADTYELSETTESLQVFLSHNWSTPRSVKFMALAFHFNHRMASACAAVACAVGFALTYSGALPTYGMSFSGGRENKAHYCTLLSLVTYWFVLLTYQDVALTTGRRGMRVFLDKCCIHQTDESLKRKGIEQLGAFLAKADTMLIIYSDTYTKKLWTMYELATFLAMRGPENLVVVPAFIASVIPRAFAVAVAYAVVTEVLSIDAVVDFVGFNRSTTQILATSFYVPLLLVTNVLFRWWAHEQQALLKSASHFDYANAKCYVESDRELVNGNIARYMRDLNLNQGRTDEEALAAFNGLVAAEVPAAVSKSLGPLGLPTRYRMIIALPAVMLLVDSMAAALKAEREGSGDPRRAVAQILASVALSALWPVSFTLMSWLTQQCLWVKSCPLEWLLILCISVLDGGNQTLFYHIVVFARQHAIDEGAGWAFLTLVLLLSFFLFVLWMTHTSASGLRDMETVRSDGSTSSRGSRSTRRSISSLESSPTLASLESSPTLASLESSPDCLVDVEVDSNDSDACN